MEVKSFLLRFKPYIFFQIWLWIAWWLIMQHWHIKNKRFNHIICIWCYVTWFSPEMVFLPMVAFPLQVIITITYSNFSYWNLLCWWNNAWSVTSWDFKIRWRFNQEFCKPEPCENWGRYHDARGHAKCGKFIIKMGTTKMGFNFNPADVWFNPEVLSFD